MVNRNSLNGSSPEEDTIKIGDLIQHLLKRWYLFVIFGLLGLVSVFILSKILQPNYKIQAELYAPNTSSDNIGAQNIFGNLGFSSRTNVQNHIGILGSHSLTRQALENLNWRVTWFESLFFSEKDLYKYSPFKIESFNPLLNLPGVKIKLTPIDSEHCLLSVNEKIKIQGVEKTIDFEVNYKYGDSLVNEYFNFVLNKEPGRSIDMRKKYLFNFNDINKLTLRYNDKLNLTLENRDAEIILMTLEGSQPERASDFLNELIRVFINYGLREKNRVAESTVAFIDSQLLGIVDSLQSTGRSFTNFRSRNRIVDLSQEAGLVVEKIDELETEESLARMRLEYYLNLSSYLGDADKMEQVIAPSVVGITDPALNTLVIQLSELYGRRSQLAFTVQEKNPSLMALDNEILYTRNSLEENLKNLISNAQIELKLIRERKNQESNQLAQLPKKEQDLANIKRQFDLNNELYTFLLQKRAEAQITKASNIPDVQVLDYAAVDTAIELGPSQGIMYLIGLFLGLLIPALIVLYTFYSDHTIKNVEDIEKETKAPVLGMLRHNFKKDELPVHTDPHSGISENFRILRTKLDYLTNTNGKKIIAIHSIIPYEGKTYFSSNLASIIAQNNKRVLLIGGDMRKAKLHTIFKIANNKGLSTYLINKDKIDDIIINSKFKDLTIIPAGPIPPNPAELLNNENLGKLLNKAKEYFDYIIIDNAPAAVVTDALIISKHADLNLFVTRAEYTTIDQIKLIEQYKNQGTIKNISIVLNDVKNNKGSGYNYYKKGYGAYSRSKYKKNNDGVLEN